MGVSDQGADQGSQAVKENTHSGGNSQQLLIDLEPAKLHVALEPKLEPVGMHHLEEHDLVTGIPQPRLLMAEIMLHPNRRPVAGTIGVWPRGE